MKYEHVLLPRNVWFHASEIPFWFSHVVLLIIGGCTVYPGFWKAWLKSCWEHSFSHHWFHDFSLTTFFQKWFSWIFCHGGHNIIKHYVNKKRCRFSFIFSPYKGEQHPNRKWACFGRYLKIINIFFFFLKTNIIMVILK